jgi:hypothetical protein
MPVLKMGMEQTSKNHTRKCERESVAVPLHSRHRKRAIHFGRIPLADPISQPTSDRTITAQMRNQRLTYCCRYLQSEEETKSHKRGEKESRFLEEKLLRMRKCFGTRERECPPSLVDRLRVVTDFIVDCEENWKRKLPGIGYVQWSCAQLIMNSCCFFPNA